MELGRHVDRYFDDHQLLIRDHARNIEVALGGDWLHSGWRRWRSLVRPAPITSDDIGDIRLLDVRKHLYADLRRQ